MNKDEIYQIAKWLSIGILLGYFGKYALNWVRNWKADNQDQEKSSETTQKQN